jgi:hypothetical protein
MVRLRRFFLASCLSTQFYFPGKRYAVRGELSQNTIEAGSGNDAALTPAVTVSVAKSIPKMDAREPATLAPEKLAAFCTPPLSDGINLKPVRLMDRAAPALLAMVNVPFARSFPAWIEDHTNGTSGA